MTYERVTRGQGQPMTRPLDIVGLAELAGLLDVDRALVRQWYHRGRLPEPDAVLAATPVWRVATIQRWRPQPSTQG